MCAFTPTFPITRMIAAIETFIEAIRMRALDEIVILSIQAEEIVELARANSYDHPFINDESVTFVKGASHTARGLEVSHFNLIFYYLQSSFELQIFIKLF